MKCGSCAMASERIDKRPWQKGLKVRAFDKCVFIGAAFSGPSIEPTHAHWHACTFWGGYLYGEQPTRWRTSEIAGDARAEERNGGCAKGNGIHASASTGCSILILTAKHTGRTEFLEGVGLLGGLIIDNGGTR